jgi:hypothetical protein
MQTVCWNKFPTNHSAATTKNSPPAMKTHYNRFDVSLRRMDYHTRLLNTVNNSLVR